MKKIATFLMIASASIALAACQEKAEEAPVTQEVAPVEAPVVEAPAADVATDEAAPADATAPADTEAAPAEDTTTM